MGNAAPLHIRTLMGDYPVTHALRSGQVRSPHIALDFADVPKSSQAFKRVVRDLEFDIAELAIVTFLMARAYGKPLVLMPAVVMCRDQHPYLVYNPDRGPLAPPDLSGRRVGIRSYSVTTSMWVRGILAEDFGVAPAQVTWVTFEECHVQEYVDPPNVERAAPGKDVLEMLLGGEVDAAVVAEIPDDPRLQPLIADPEAAGRRWRQRHQALQINHMVVARESLSRDNPLAVREYFRLLAESKQLSGLRDGGGTDDHPMGLENLRRSLDVAIDYVYRQQLIPRRFSADELFDDTTRTLLP